MGVFFEGCREGVHKFEPRYDEEPNPYRFTSVKGIFSEDMRELMIIRKYVKDVCVRCGKTIER